MYVITTFNSNKQYLKYILQCLSFDHYQMIMIIMNRLFNGLTKWQFVLLIIELVFEKTVFKSHSCIQSLLYIK